MPAREALIIASAQYSDPLLRLLKAPEADAISLREVLSNRDIGGFQAKALIDRPSYEVAAAIDEFFIDRQPEDLLLLYFSGHGIKDADGRLFFATTDTRRSLLLSTSIPASMVNDAMLRSRSRRQVLILDCCHSGAFARGMVAKSDGSVGTIEHFQGTGRIVLTASDATQYALEAERVTGAGVRSIFTEIIVEGLRTGAADTNFDGLISLDELYTYAEDCVLKRTPTQRPMKWALGATGAMIIAQNKNPVIHPADLPPNLIHSLDKESPPAFRQFAARELGKILGGNDRALALAAELKLRELLEDDSRKIEEIARGFLTDKTRREDLERQRQEAFDSELLAEEERQRQVAAENAQSEKEELERAAADKIARVAEEEHQRQIATENARREREEQEQKAAAERVHVAEAERLRQIAAENTHRQKEEFEKQATIEASRRIEEERQRQIAGENERSVMEELEHSQKETEAARNEQLKRVRHQGDTLSEQLTLREKTGDEIASGLPKHHADRNRSKIIRTVAFALAGTLLLLVLAWVFSRHPSPKFVSSPLDSSSLSRPQTGQTAPPPPTNQQHADVATIEQQADALYKQKRYTEAKSLFDQACDGGSGKACDILGWMYENKIGVELDYKKAVFFYSKACNINFGQGCNDLGNAYYEGKSVTPDFAGAASLYIKSCTLGYPNGCSNVGFVYDQKPGLLQNYSTMVDVFNKACIAGIAYGCNYLGTMYASGQGVSRNDARAFALYREACIRGYGNGCDNEGSSYLYGGDGVPKNSEAAKKSFKKGCSLGSTWACDHFKSMK